MAILKESFLQVIEISYKKAKFGGIGSAPKHNVLQYTANATDGELKLVTLKFNTSLNSVMGIRS